MPQGRYDLAVEHSLTSPVSNTERLLFSTDSQISCLTFINRKIIRLFLFWYYQILFEYIYISLSLFFSFYIVQIKSKGLLIRLAMTKIRI